MSLGDTKTPQKFRVARTHPNFFWLLVVFSLATLIISLTMVCAGHRYYDQPAWNVSRAVLPLQAWGYFGLVAAACKTYGLASNHLRIVRLGTAMSALFYGTLGLSLGFAFFLYHSTAPTGMVLWTAIAVVHVFASTEPFSNPANRK